MEDFARVLPTVHQDPTDPDFVSDPYTSYAKWRAEGDFVYWADYQMPMATTHAAVNQVLRHSAMGRALPTGRAPQTVEHMAAFNALEARSLLEIEPPDHTRLRRVAMTAFTGPQIALVAPRISQFADGLIDAFPSGPFDLIDAYCKPLAALTITDFLGVDTAMASQLQHWSNDMVAMYQARRNPAVEVKAEAAAAAFASYIRDVVAERRQNPGEDFLSQLVKVRDTGGISEAEMISTAILLLNAGHEATVHAVGNAVPLLLAFENRSDALAPDGIAGTVEECLRFKPPLHLFKRYVYAPTILDDLPFEAGSEIGCLLGSACRDDATWPDGDVFDPFRARVRHAAFGIGLHACLGAALARLEMQVALPVLFARCPQLQLAELPEVANLYHFHGYKRLLVIVK
ncbi:MAG: cytochrome P450 [Paracoccaceae bacterium]